MYADATYYTDIYKGTVIPAADIDTYLEKSSENIDILTFNRIIKISFDKLTVYQQETVKHVACQYADFLHENLSDLETALSSYSINGVQASFTDAPNIISTEGLMIRKDIYANLSKTGLTFRGI